MTTPSDLWPPFGLLVRTGDLTLTPVADVDPPRLVELAQAGVHAPDLMPFETPWTAAPSEDLPRQFAAYHWSNRASYSRESAEVVFAVRRGSHLVGTQGFTARDFAITGTARGEPVEVSGAGPLRALFGLD